MRIISAALAFALLASCATAARATLNDRFRAIGLSPDMADCLVDDLDQRLDDRDLRDLADFTVGLSRADNAIDAVDSLRRIDNPRAVAAIGRAAFTCVTGFVR
ncbi:MAG: hypothetical protein A3E78_16800 [Alphaproteobacteria bacterium RIFCSPHIGHO2_12_FULL_63_12]|nr:MAG: hypothetical protein A3E78_16800 [Alphaproteobacteria bacterium RIFCSPHIGHO2_12_FULL_63_12]